jgi:hypothetical protein
MDLWELPPIDPHKINPAYGFAESIHWLRGRDAQQNFLSYFFTFLMVPVQLKNPKTAYRLCRIP